MVRLRGRTAEVPGPGDAARHLPDAMAPTAGPEFGLQILPGITAAEVLPVSECLAVLHQGKVDVAAAEHLRHGAAVAVGGCHLQVHRRADRQPHLQVVPRALAVGSLGHLWGVDAGQSHGDRPLPLAYADGVAVAVESPWPAGVVRSRPGAESPAAGAVAAGESWTSMHFAPTFTERRELPLPQIRPPRAAALQLREKRPEFDLGGRSRRLVQHPGGASGPGAHHSGTAGHRPELERGGPRWARGGAAQQQAAAAGPAGGLQGKCALGAPAGGVRPGSTRPELMAERHD